MKIRTANRRRARAHRREVLAEARAYHEARCIRLEAAGRLDRLGDSGFVRRRCRRVKGFGTPDVVKTRFKWYAHQTFRQPWLEGLKPMDRRPRPAAVVDDPADGGPMHYHLLDLKPKLDNY